MKLISGGLKLASPTIAVITLGLLLSFQNCGQATNFSQNASSNSSKQSTQPSVAATPLPATGSLAQPTPQPLNTTIAALICAAGSTAAPAAQQYYPTNCLIDPKIPATSLGFESNNNYQAAVSGQLNQFSLAANNQASGTANDSLLYIEVATYVAPDTIRVAAVDGKGAVLTLLDICNVSTYTSGDPTHGVARPYSDTILQFEVLLPKGTKSLLFDFSGALTPTYLGVWNLNEFSTALLNDAGNPFSAAPSQKSQFRVQQGAPSRYNDNADPLLPTSAYCR